MAPHSQDCKFRPNYVKTVLNSSRLGTLKGHYNGPLGRNLDNLQDKYIQGTVQGMEVHKRCVRQL